MCEAQGVEDEKQRLAEKEGRHNMPADCVKKKIAAGMSRKAAHAACYPAGKKGSLKRAVKSVQASVGGAKARRGIKKYEKK